MAQRGGARTGTSPSFDADGWLRRWDAQQQGYVPQREARFDIMLDVLAGLLPADFLAVDLGCGPGSLSQRVLARFPEARVVAVDLDPVLLAIGRRALGDDPRLRFVEADMASPQWRQALGERSVDAVLSSTALHWLQPEELRRLYGDLASLVRAGGVVLNADHLPYLPGTRIERLSSSLLDEQWSQASFVARGIETAEQWWAAAAAEPGFAALLDERTARFAAKQRPTTRLGVDDHVAALRAAGFAEVATVWQVLSDRVVVAVR